MNAGFDLDLDIAERELAEAQRLMESARGRLVHAQSLAPLPRAGVVAAGGVITAIGLMETAREQIGAARGLDGVRTHSAHSAGSATGSGFSTNPGLSASPSPKRYGGTGSLAPKSCGGTGPLVAA